MKLLFDTNIVLDVLLRRKPWLASAEKLWASSDAGFVIGYLTATTMTDIFYVAQKQHGVEKALLAVDTCLKAFKILPVTRHSLELARAFSGADFENNLQIACAILHGLDAIVTRNVADFQNAQITIFTPEQALNSLKN